VEAEEMDSRLLVKKTLAGTKKAFESIIEGHQRLVSHIVFRMIQNASDREDVCQDVFLKVYQNLRGFQFEAKLSTWIARIAYNTCLNYLEKKRVPLFDDLTSEEKTIETVSDCSVRPDEIVEGREVFSLLQNEIEKMPVHYRTIVTLYHLDQMSYKEIGEMMELPEGTVKSYLFRARRLLKERLLTKYQREDLCH
jgi:RNA polymerase sigma-70 factor (ECF subfamily)